jgi:cytochrome c oxidase subunit 4
MGWLNVGSLILGSIAWTLPVIGFLFFRKKYPQPSFGLVALSFAACAIAIFFQMMYNQYLIDINDMSALLDTSKATTTISGILLIFTAILNALNITIRIRKSN